ncbi:MAG TPA: hypothetical protein PKW15_07255, partial [Alphaproteobacteria bacterium]|nr:hypothetical protein [Alphaproteobacteria bacterium]
RDEISQKAELFLIQRFESGNGVMKMVYNNNQTGQTDCVLDIPLDGSAHSFRQEPANFAGTSSLGPYAVLAATLDYPDGSQRTIRLGKAPEIDLPGYIHLLDNAAIKNSKPAAKPSPPAG